MFSGIKKSMAEAREADEAKKMADQAALNKVFEYEPGNRRWEYCLFIYAEHKSLPNGRIMKLDFVDEKGQPYCRDLDKDVPRYSAEPAQIIAELGMAGWELTNRNVNREADPNDPKHILATGQYHFKRSKQQDAAGSSSR